MNVSVGEINGAYIAVLQVQNPQLYPDPQLRRIHSSALILHIINVLDTSRIESPTWHGIYLTDEPSLEWSRT